jgi:hypothetical protein
LHALSSQELPPWRLSARFLTLSITKHAGANPEATREVRFTYTKNCVRFRIARGQGRLAKCRIDPDRLLYRAIKGLMMSIAAHQEPDMWDLVCRGKLDSMPRMLEQLYARPQVVEPDASDTNRWKVLDAEVSEQMRVRATVVKQMYEAECELVRNESAAHHAPATVASFGNIDFDSKELGGGADRIPPPDDTGPAAVTLTKKCLSIEAQAWLDLVSMSAIGYVDFNKPRAEKEIKGDQIYFRSHPAIGDGPAWEKYLIQQFDACEREKTVFPPGPMHLHARAQTWSKLRLLRTPLEYLDHETRQIVRELRNERIVPPPRALPSIETPELRRWPEIFSDAGRTGLQRASAESANSNPAPPPHEYVPGSKEILEGAERGALVGAQANVVPFPSRAKIVGAIENKCVSVLDLLSGGDRYVYQLQEALHLSPKNKKALQDAIELQKGIGLSSAEKDLKWSDAIRGQIKRCTYLQRAFVVAESFFSAGYPVPFDTAAADAVRTKLISSKRLPKGAIELFVARLRIFLEREAD